VNTNTQRERERERAEELKRSGEDSMLLLLVCATSYIRKNKKEISKHCLSDNASAGACERDYFGYLCIFITLKKYVFVEKG